MKTYHYQRPKLAKFYPGEDPEALEVPGVRIVVEQMAA